MEKKQLTQFTFFDLYAELMDTLTDEERGKMLRAMCEFMFADGVQTELKDKKLIFLWGTSSTILTWTKRPRRAAERRRV